MTVADTGVLIWLARYNKLGLLVELYGKIDIPPGVFEKAVTDGKLNGYPDAGIIGTVEDNKEIVVRKIGVSEKIDRMEEVFNCKLGGSEREAIILALKSGSSLLITDEVASTISKSPGVRTKGVLFILLNW